MTDHSRVGLPNTACCCCALSEDVLCSVSDLSDLPHLSDLSDLAMYAAASWRLTN